MTAKAALAFVGLCAGIIVSSGAVALIIGLNVIPRYAGITRTAQHVILYENVCIAGVLAGNFLSFYNGTIPLGWPGLFLYGSCSGIFLGSWIIALGEVVDIFAITARRIGLTRGMPFIIVSMALGKTLGSLLFFWKGWWK